MSQTSTCRWQLDAKDWNVEDRSWQEIEIWKLLAKRWKKAPHTDGVMEKARSGQVSVLEHPGAC